MAHLTDPKARTDGHPTSTSRLDATSRQRPAKVASLARVVTDQ